MCPSGDRVPSGKTTIDQPSSTSSRALPIADCPPRPRSIGNPPYTSAVNAGPTGTLWQAPGALRVRPSLHVRDHDRRGVEVRDGCPGPNGVFRHLERVTQRVRAPVPEPRHRLRLATDEDHVAAVVAPVRPP